MRNYKYDKEAQGWIVKTTKSASRFERKMTQVCIVAFIAVFVISCDAIAAFAGF